MSSACLGKLYVTSLAPSVPYRVDGDLVSDFRKQGRNGSFDPMIKVIGWTGFNRGYVLCRRPGLSTPRWVGLGIFPLNHKQHLLSWRISLAIAPPFQLKMRSTIRQSNSSQCGLAK